MLRRGEGMGNRIGFAAALGIALAATGLVGGKSAMAATATDATAARSLEDGGRLAEYAEFLIYMVEQRMKDLGGQVDFASSTERDANGVKYVLRAGTRAPAETLPLATRQFLGNLKELRIIYRPYQEKIFFRMAMRGWTSVQLKSLKDAKRNELVALGIPEQVGYVIRSTEHEISFLADSPRSDRAIRLHPHSRIGNMWLRELHYDPDTLKGRIHLGVAGNAISLRANFTFNASAAPGESPIAMDPDVNRTLKDNAPLAFALAPILLLLF